MRFSSNWKQLKKIEIFFSFKVLGRIAQLVRALALHARCPWFESGYAHSLCGGKIEKNIFIISRDFSGVIFVSEKIRGA